LRLKPLKRLGSGTIMDLKALEAQVEQARKQGWMWVENEGGDGIAALAVAGLIDDEPLAISIAGPVDRLRPRREKYLEVLQEVQALVFRSRQDVDNRRASVPRRRPRSAATASGAS